MDFKDVAKIVIDAAPGLGAALAPVTGGASMGIGIALKALGSVFGLGDSPAPEAVVAAIQADPEAAFKLKVAEQNFILEMRKADNAELVTYLADVQNARARDLGIRQSGKLNLRADVMLVSAFVVVFSIYFICAYFGETRIGTLVVGSMLTAAGTFIQKIGTAFDFEFGSSRIQVEQSATMAASSARKTELLAQK